MPVATNYYDGTDFHAVKVFSDDELKEDAEIGEDIITGRLMLMDSILADKDTYNSLTNHASSKDTIFLIELFVSLGFSLFAYDVVMRSIEKYTKRDDIFNKDNNIQFILLFIGVGVIAWNSMYNFNIDKELSRLHSEKSIEKMNNYISTYVEKNSISHILKDGTEATVYRLRQDVVLKVLQSKEGFEGKLNIADDMPYIYMQGEKMYFECLKDGYVLYRK